MRKITVLLIAVAMVFAMGIVVSQAQDEENFDIPFVLCWLIDWGDEAANSDMDLVCFDVNYRGFSMYDLLGYYEYPWGEKAAAYGAAVLDSNYGWLNMTWTAGWYNYINSPEQNNFYYADWSMNAFLDPSTLNGWGIDDYWGYYFDLIFLGVGPRTLIPEK